MKDTPSINNQLKPMRIWVFLGAIVLVFGIFIGRLFILQVLEKDQWVAKAQDNSVSYVQLASLTRGDLRSQWHDSGSQHRLL